MGEPQSSAVLTPVKGEEEGRRIGQEKPRTSMQPLRNFSAGLIGSCKAGCTLEEHHVGQEWFGSSMSAVLSQTGRRTEIA